MTAVTTLSRQEIKKLTVDLLDTNEDKTLTKEYLDAVRSMDTEKISWFRSFGDCVRQQIMNADAYQHGLLYGFTAMTFNKYGWLDNVQWTEYEEIELPAKDEHIVWNTIRLACGTNGNWTYGLGYSYGSGAGGGFNPSVFDIAFETKQDCLTAAVDQMRTDFEEKIEQAIERPDPSNFNVPYMRTILKKIEDLHVTRVLNQVQLNLFA